MLSESELMQSAHLIKSMESVVGSNRVVYQAVDADGELLPIVVSEAYPENDQSTALEIVELCRCSTMNMTALIAELINDAPVLYESLQEQRTIIEKYHRQVVALSDAIDDALSILRSGGEMSFSRTEDVLTAGIFESARLIIGDDADQDEND